MPVLESALAAWEAGSFDTALKSELVSLPADRLPLQQATSQGGIVDDRSITISVLSSQCSEQRIESRVCVFFDEIVGGCNCHDDPVSSHSQCIMLVSIDRRTGEADFTIMEQ